MASVVFSGVIILPQRKNGFGVGPSLTEEEARYLAPLTRHLLPEGYIQVVREQNDRFLGGEYVLGWYNPKEPRRIYTTRRGRNLDTIGHETVHVLQHPRGMGGSLPSGSYEPPYNVNTFPYSISPEDIPKGMGIPHFTKEGQALTVTSWLEAVREYEEKKHAPSYITDELQKVKVGLSPYVQQLKNVRIQEQTENELARGLYGPRVVRKETLLEALRRVFMKSKPPLGWELDGQ